jgi:AbrB family looped-hinge helix DNA binding protein
VIDKAGRVVIPKPLREELHLEPGDALEMESAGEQITLRPVRGTGPLVKEHGVWVFHSDQPLAASVTDELLRQIREERDQSNLGNGE